MPACVTVQKDRVKHDGANSRMYFLPPGMRHYMGIMMPPQESDAWSYELFKGRLVAHMQRSDNWSQPQSALFADLDRIDPELRPKLQPKREAAYLYDAVMVYAHSLAKVRKVHCSSANEILINSRPWYIIFARARLNE